ncbi:hypothetical protein GTP55_01225 [Duganella sp. FT109W]|uniref:LA2681-like HEPN domain-containing protein n=1 Tax=Duganella margarita TaxID=2692170 RepID=A0ABW9WAN8_9BURK|nr:hypothetical protein [Duganella margarita]MYN37988.1 hypothetical protein [Duganella margarita]
MSNMSNTLRNTASSIEKLADMEESQRINLTQTLADILTLELHDADVLISDYPEDALDLYVAFAETVQAYGEHAREWRQNTMTLLPFQYWKPLEAESGPYLVSENPYTSLKYLSHREFSDTKAQQQLNNRKALHTALSELLRVNVHAKYAPLLSWDADELVDVSGVARYPHLKDIVLWQLTHAVEDMFNHEYRLLEDEYRTRHGSPDTDATPSSAIRKLAKDAVERVHLHLASWTITGLFSWAPFDMGEYVVGEPLPEVADTGQRGHLILRVMCNMAANRVLLERARLDGLGAIGAEANQALLQALNRNGIFQAPHYNDYDYDEDGIRKLLDAWFGPDGIVAKDKTYPCSLRGQDLEVVLAQARHIRHQYTHTRGHYAGGQHATEYSSFLFALAVAACHFGKIKLPDEFSLGRTKPVIPARNLGERRMDLVGPEAIELLKAMYGQLFYGNSGYQLSAEGTRRYADDYRWRHAYLQDLLFNMFKRLSPSQLLYFDGVMMKLARRNEKGLGSLDREATANAHRLVRFGLALQHFYQA